jgi:hypothetical protein
MEAPLIWAVCRFVIMKRILGLIIVLAIVFAACTKNVVVVNAPKKAPPGQVKKITGSQSAQPYATGQTKKKK